MDGPSVRRPQTSSEVYRDSTVCFAWPPLYLGKLSIMELYELAGDGVVVRGPAYGVRSIRVDGNDALAMYSSVQAAREMAIDEQRPILIEVREFYLFVFFSSPITIWKSY